MNERIKELAHKAEFINKRHNGDEWRWGYIDPELSAKLEKFAELIVKETITEMCQQLYWHGEDQSNNPSFYKAIDKTKKHFGVEE